MDQFSIGQPPQAGGSAGAGNPTTAASGSGGVNGSGTGGNGGEGGELDAGPDAPPPECTTNRQCAERATEAWMARVAEGGAPVGDGGDSGAPTLIDGMVPAVCVKPRGTCVELLTPDCKITVGDYLDDNAILLGTLFSTTGPQAATNLQRQQSATLAFEEINDKGGVPPSTANGPRRKLVVLSCDEVANLTRAGTHLVNELHVPAIVGPNTSQDTLKVSQDITIMGGTVVMTPSAVASSIAALEDNDLTWLMAPSDLQRAPLMIAQINEIEAQLKMPPPMGRGKSTIKFGIIYRDDALGQGTQLALVPLTINGASLTTGINQNTVRVDKYLPTAPNQSALVATYKGFAPDIIALAGTAEAITQVMVPLEEQWGTEGGADRPYYVTIDSAKVPELLAAVNRSLSPPDGGVPLPSDLRQRVRGTGITPLMQSVLDSFQFAYRGRYGSAPTASSTGPSYDAAYAIGYALAATKDLPVTGKNIALGLRRLFGGSTVIDVGSTTVLAAFQKLAGAGDGGGEKITANGTFGPLEWDMSGAPMSAKLEMWCVTVPGGGMAAYASSGLFFDLKTKQSNGTYSQCP